MDIINKKQLDELKSLENSSSEKIISELVKLFQHQLIDFLSKSKDAIRSGNYARLAQLAHFLKSSSGNLGLNHAYEICLLIESSAKHSKDIPYMEKLNELEIYTALALEEIKLKYMSAA